MTSSPRADRHRWLGVMGGGQLGRMWVHAAQVHGYHALVLEPDLHSPAAAAADQHLAAPYLDAAALRTLAGSCIAVTTEFENVPAQALRQLQAAGCTVSPPPDAVQVCQHRAREKAAFVAAGVPCAPHALLQHEADLAQPGLAALLPGILKTASLGYDGKGQAHVATLADLPAAWRALGAVPCVLEQRLALRCEVSVIVARGADGTVVHLPVQHNLHRGGILAVTQVPATATGEVSSALTEQAVQLATRLAQALAYVGVLCVEFFVVDDGSAVGALVANEIAPRPHNSGHYSIDACDVSQFDLQVRTLAGLPLVAPRQHSAAVMLNLLGDLWFNHGGQQAQEPHWPALLALPGVRLHLYGKAEARPGRKMGHVTVTAPRLHEARATAQHAAALLGLAPF
jgi:5-(carboxyamino)imidazole ribonucleotide synthase